VRYGTDGRNERASYERRFVRGESLEKDKIRLESEGAYPRIFLIYGGGRLWGIINGALHSAQDAANTSFRNSVTASTRCCATRKRFHADFGRQEAEGIDLHVLDLVDKDKHPLAIISAKTLHILWLEYETLLLPVRAS